MAISFLKDILLGDDIGEIKIKSFSHNILRIIILAVSSFTISLIVFLSNILGIFELKAYDLYSRYLNPIRSSGNIVVVQVDQESIDALSKEGITWPWPRQIYAPIIEYLSKADAIFIDILFTEPSSYGQEDDKILTDAFKKASNVYLPIFLSHQEEIMPSEEEEFIKHIAIKDKVSAGSIFNSVITPIDTFKSAIRGAGNVTISPDEDGVYRGIPLFFQLKQFIIPHFLLGYLVEKGVVKIKQDSIYINTHGGWKTHAKILSGK